MKHYLNESVHSSHSNKARQNTLGPRPLKTLGITQPHFLDYEWHGSHIRRMTPSPTEPIRHWHASFTFFSSFIHHETLLSFIKRRKEPVSSHENTGLASSSIGFICIIYTWKWSHHATSTEGTIYERKKRMPFNKVKHSTKDKTWKENIPPRFWVEQPWISKPLSKIQHKPKKERKRDVIEWIRQKE